jgi:hypothetical protein
MSTLASYFNYGLLKENVYTIWHPAYVVRVCTTYTEVSVLLIIDSIFKL